MGVIISKNSAEGTYSTPYTLRAHLTILRKNRVIIGNKIGEALSYTYVSRNGRKRREEEERKRGKRLKGDFAEGRKVSGDTSCALGFAENSLRDSLVWTRPFCSKLGIPVFGGLHEKATHRAHGAAWTLEWMIDGRPMSIGAAEKTGSPRVETLVERSRERPSKPVSTYVLSLSLSCSLFSSGSPSPIAVLKRSAPGCTRVL